MSLPTGIPKDLSNLLQVMATDFPAILREDLIGIYLWGSLTYNAFDATCSDVDSIVVTRRDLDDREFSELDEWFRNRRDQNRWVERIDMRFVIENEFLDKTSRCCGFYHHTGKLVRHGSDGNPIIWLNIAQSGITLCGKDAKLIVPRVSDEYLNDALLLELNYLKEGWPPKSATGPTKRSSTTPTRSSPHAASFTLRITEHWFPKARHIPGR